MIAMPDFSEPVTEAEAKKLCNMAADTFKQFRESAGYRNGEVPTLAFVRSDKDSYGNYQDGVFFDNMGVYIVRWDTKDFSVVFKKTPINEHGIRPDVSLSEAERGSLWGEYWAHHPIPNEVAMKRRHEEFLKDFYHL